MTEIMPVPRNLSFTVLPAESLRGAVLISNMESALAELRCATGCLEAVLAYSLAPVFLDFMGFLASALKCCPSI